MQDQATAISAAYSAAFDALAARHETTGERWTDLDLARGTLLELRARGERISRVTVNTVLGRLVSDGFLMAQTSEVLFWDYGDVDLATRDELWHALDEVEVGRAVEQAFWEGAQGASE